MRMGPSHLRIVPPAPAPAARAAPVDAYGIPTHFPSARPAGQVLPLPYGPMTYSQLPTDTGKTGGDTTIHPCSEAELTRGGYFGTTPDLQGTATYPPPPDPFAIPQGDPDAPGAVFTPGYTGGSTAPGYTDPGVAGTTFAAKQALARFGAYNPSGYYSSAAAQAINRAGQACTADSGEARAGESLSDCTARLYPNNVRTALEQGGAAFTTIGNTISAAITSGNNVEIERIHSAALTEQARYASQVANSTNAQERAVAQARLDDANRLLALTQANASQVAQLQAQFQSSQAASQNNTMIYLAIGGGVLAVTVLGTVLYLVAKK